MRFPSTSRRIKKKITAKLRVQSGSVYNSGYVTDTQVTGRVERAPRTRPTHDASWTSDNPRRRER